jgi:Dolichyl-phosphate-mannose-protein mannosyltransferase
MTSRRSSRRVPADAANADAARIAAWLVAVLLIPRILRMLYPEVWVEDDFYLEAAWMVSVGMRPYLDFVHPHMPLLEWIAAGYLKLFGASYRSIEFLNEAAIFVTSLLTFSLARRVAGRPTAIAASILYAYSSLVFRYHAYERECFVAPLLVLAAIVTLDDAMPAIRQAVLLAAIFFFACAIKLTALIILQVMLLYVIFAYRRIVSAIASGVIFTILLAAFTAILYWLYGSDFIFQTFIFHFMKGRDSALDIAMFPRMVLDVLAPLLVLGIIRLIAQRAFNRGIVLVLAIVAVEYAFYGALSPTAWAHNYLEALPFIAIIAAVGAMSVLIPVRDLLSGEAESHEWLLVAGRVALILIFLIWITPIVNDSWLHGAIYGFGYMPRAELTRLADALRLASKPDDDVIAPSFICFEANRRELIRFPETYGVYREAKAEYDRDGFFAARRRLGSADFFQLISDTRHYWTDQMKDAIASGKVSAVISDSPIQLLPLVLVPEDFLTSNGFRPALVTDHFTLWTKAPASEGTANP